MNFSEIYSSTLEYWPTEISIEDGKDIEGTSGNFKTLSQVWRSVEQKTETESEAINLMVWAIFAGFHKAATTEFLKGTKTISPSHIDINYVAHKFDECLDDPDNTRFENVQSVYVNDLNGAT
ncbi:MAG: hypothetical protein OCD76_16935 [Reichenbachiella sp.]